VTANAAYNWGSECLIRPEVVTLTQLF